MVFPGVVTFELAFATIFANSETFLVIFLTMVIVELVVALADADAELLAEAEGVTWPGRLATYEIIFSEAKNIKESAT